MVMAAVLAGGSALPQTSSTLPRSAEEALRQLRHTQAAEADWSTFPNFASVAVKNRVREGNGPSVENDASIFLERKDDGTAELMLLANGRSTYLPASFDRPELDASKATFVRQERITAAGKTYSTTVYSFEVETEGLESVFMTRQLFWLAAGVPGGVVRHESTGVESGELVTPAGTSSRVLSELDAPFTVQGKVLHAYCYTSQIDLTDGTREVSRACKHASVPGGIVRYEVRELKNGLEVRFETTDLEEADVPAAPARSSGADPNFGCTFPASLLGDAARNQLESGDYKAAVASYDALIRVDPKCASAYNDRGFAKLKLDDNAGALADFNHAIELSPSLTQAYVNRAVLERNRNDLKGALADCNAALKIDPKSFNALVNRMVTYMRLFEDDRALKDYRAALEVSPSAGDSLDRVMAEVRKSRGPRR